MVAPFLQPFPPPSPPTRRVRPMSGPSPSRLALESSGFSLSPTRETVPKGSKFPTSLMMVSLLYTIDLISHSDPSVFNVYTILFILPSSLFQRTTSS